MSFYKNHHKFDWKFYIRIYPDIKKANINTEKLAIQHYLKYGINENRRTYPIITTNTKVNSISFNAFTKMTTQIYVSDALTMFKHRFMTKFKLTSYNNLTTSSLFFGVYTTDDLETIQNHKGLKLVIWGGEDSNPNNLHSKQTLGEIKNIPNIIHLSISKTIYNSLKISGIQSILIDFNLVDTLLFYPIPKTELGRNIFIFNGQHKGRGHIYGEKYYIEVMKKLPRYNYVLSNTLNAKWEDMPNIYKRCFIMLRLTNHDGNANSVQECEAMDIPVIHNQSDYGLKWGNIDDIIRHIKNVSTV